MNVLGISCYYHDAAAALVRDGVVIAAGEEERFTRRKHDRSFPANAIRFCLEFGGLQGSDLDLVVFYEKPLRKLQRGLQMAAPLDARSRETVSRHIRHHVHQMATLPQLLADTISYRGELQYCEHHLSHAASCFYASPFHEAAILTIDGVGEWVTTGQFLGSGNRIESVREIHYPQSLGMFYAALTAYLGFEVNEGEYKVMGLASYGKPTFAAEMARLIELNEDGSFRLDLSYFDYVHSLDRMFSSKLVELLGPPRLPTEPVERRHMDIAASAQKRVEETLICLVHSLRDVSRSRNLCMAGGVSHNVVANSTIQQSGLFDGIFIQPASGDNGAAVGAALEGYWRSGDSPRAPHLDYNTCLGPAFDEVAIVKVLKSRRLSFRKLGANELCREVANLVHHDLVVGWFQGRMEFGPRALGQRSILGNACNPATKDTLNMRVKLREEFRPFAPIVIEEAMQIYFDQPAPSPYMLYAPRVRSGMEARVPAAIHVDGTSRVQTVSSRHNPLLHRLLKEFEALSGVPVMINTSFNVKGEPIVCTPEDAVKCFLRTDIDYLAIGDFLVEKSF
ncbi:MAG: carbamoyltransferase N-terminal domain-containing protein [Reyranella sp.]|uniref:carbamoyltransferase family protein n=1 Tax=Reyranella sp. TaxID=1929291 RepID=UPI0027304820|nr:carbamoyltransferase N-terminal domain-containing protein [Reyranella sp.]MDP1965605.1 carbamoyltransferase N-terminal domain-containing protein [Reyranella sp.]MDP2377500.1 carbamoyltransferase N-terminal domain-containing protein [Reyranella sp.]